DHGARGASRHEGRADPAGRAKRRYCDRVGPDRQGVAVEVDPPRWPEAPGWGAGRRLARPDGAATRGVRSSVCRTPTELDIGELTRSGYERTEQNDGHKAGWLAERGWGAVLRGARWCGVRGPAGPLVLRGDLRGERGCLRAV